jgi:UDP-glucose-4-epimerase GalE
MTRRIVVTGGCGYIGSHVARAFKQNGDQVLIIDRVLRLHTLKDIDGYHIGDFADDSSLAAIYDYNPDVIVHCAGTSLVGPSMDDPGVYYDNNISKTIKMLNFVKYFRKKPLIMFSSSAAVYGEPEKLPITESARKQPISPYGNTKLITETILRDYWGAYALPSLCFRYFNAAGAEPFAADLGQEPGATHIVARALEASIAGRAFTINGGEFDTEDGTCIRDYVHVWDIAQAHVKGTDYVLRSGVPNQGASVFNLGTNSGVSNKQIVDYVVEHYGLPFVNYGPMRYGDPAQLIADATEAQARLAWKPEYSSIDTIIDTAYRWYIGQNIKVNAVDTAV